MSASNLHRTEVQPPGVPDAASRAARRQLALEKLAKLLNAPRAAATAAAGDAPGGAYGRGEAEADTSSRVIRLLQV